jgi:hypothetical protein
LKELRGGELVKTIQDQIRHISIPYSGVFSPLKLSLKNSLEEGIQRELA